MPKFDVDARLCVFEPLDVAAPLDFAVLAAHSPAAPHSSRTSEPFATSWVEIESALEVISPDCSRDEWIHVGMALQWAGSQTDQVARALWLWNKWSAGSADKYPGEGNIVIQWRSFRPDKVQ